MVGSGYWVVMSTSIAERPSGPTWMGLARISPGEPGVEERTFECSTCHWILKVSFPIDPIKTDAVRWMASELRPARYQSARKRVRIQWRNTRPPTEYL